MKTKQTFVDLDNARVDEQRDVMKDIMAAGHCPFCWDVLKKYHHQPIMKQGTYWIITPNQWPYENVAMQLLAIYRDHVETIHEIEPAAGAELLTLLGEIELEHQIPGGGLAMRFGDTNYSAGTVKHIHAQFIWPDINKVGFQPVRFKIGKNAEKRSS